MKGRMVVAAPCRTLLAVKTTVNGDCHHYQSFNFDFKFYHFNLMVMTALMRLMKTITVNGDRQQRFNIFD